MVHPLSGRYDYRDADFADIHSRADAGDLEAIAIGAAILYQGFERAPVDMMLSRQWLEHGAEIEAAQNTEDKTCTLQLAVYQTASLGMIGEEKKGRDTLVAHRRLIMDQAAAGHVQYMRILAFMHARGGIGVERDAERAVELFHLCAEKNDPFALYDLGLAYDGYLENVADEKFEHLRKIKVDHVEAARYLKRAAELGHADAQRETGLIITNLLVGEIQMTARIAQRITEEPATEREYDNLQNAAYGMQMLEASAAQGRIGAYYSLGRAYDGIPAFNNAVQRDIAKAAEWYKKAVDKGFIPATVELAKLYETWFAETGETHEEHNKGNALNIYDHLLGRPRKPGETVVLATIPLTPQQLKTAQEGRARLEAEAIKDSRTWYRYANGDRRLTFDDGTSIIMAPHQDMENPRKNVPADIKLAQAYETGSDGHVRNLNEAYSIYKDLLARKEGGEYTLPTADEIKQIKKLMAQIESKASSVITQPDGKRTLIFKGGAGKPDELVFADAKEVPDYKKKKAEAKAAKAPERPADTSQTTDKTARQDKGKKNET